MDEYTRELERRWEATGGAADEGALLKELTRAGVVALRNLELAATLEFEPARLALSSPIPGFSPTELLRHGESVLLQAAMGAAVAVIEQWERTSRKDGSLLRESVRLARLVEADPRRGTPEGAELHTKASTAWGGAISNPLGRDPSWQCCILAVGATLWPNTVRVERVTKSLSLAEEILQGKRADMLAAMRRALLPERLPTYSRSKSQ